MEPMNCIVQILQNIVLQANFDIHGQQFYCLNIQFLENIPSIHLHKTHTSQCQGYLQNYKHRISNLSHKNLHPLTDQLFSINKIHRCSCYINTILRLFKNIKSSCQVSENNLRKCLLSLLVWMSTNLNSPVKFELTKVEKSFLIKLILNGKGQ